MKDPDDYEVVVISMMLTLLVMWVAFVLEAIK